jgi:hypothetical protein
MKKIIYIILSFSMLVGFFSCKKNYVCTCTTTTTEPSYTSNGVTYSGSTDQSIEQETYEENKKSSAEAACSFKEYEISLTSPNSAQGQAETTEVKECDLNEF